ncbi:hypothetical protein D3C85_1849580 [compost metagenome]
MTAGAFVLEAFYNMSQAIADGIEVRMINLFRITHEYNFAALSDPGNDCFHFMLR